MMRYSQVVLLCCRAGVHVFGHLGARGVFVVAAAQTAGSRLGRGAGICRLGTGSCNALLDIPLQEGMPVYKIAIAGASTLLGKELKDALSDSPLAAASFVLLDENEALGQLDQVGDEVTFVQRDRCGCLRPRGLHVFLRLGGSDAEALEAGAAGRLDGAGSLRRAGSGDGRAGARAVARRRKRPARICLRRRWFRRTPRHWRWRLLMERLQQTRAGAIGRGHGAGAGQRVWPRGHGRAASADGESAQLSDVAAGHLRRAGGLQSAFRAGRKRHHQPERRRGAGAPALCRAGRRSLACP